MSRVGCLTPGLHCTLRVMVDADEARRARAAERRGRIVLRKTHLGDEVDLDPIRGVEAMALAAQLSLHAWSMAGQPPPAPTGGRETVRFVRRDT